MDRARARHLRLRAEELRTVAEGMRDDTTRLRLLNAAKSYDTLAAVFEPPARPSTICRNRTSKRFN